MKVPFEYSCNAAWNEDQKLGYQVGTGCDNLVKK